MHDFPKQLADPGFIKTNAMHHDIILLKRIIHYFLRVF